ncbi:MAG: neutral zinc metallopeptidase [Acidobacteria bacterium]|nr:neutral zinc metallopeptidase [Acidobacteriota bacterium]
MKWNPGGRSENLEDRRGSGGGGGFRLGGGGGKLGLGGFLLLFVLSIVFKKDFFALVGAGGGGPVVSTQPAPGGGASASPEEEKMVQFVSFVLDDTQATWKKLAPGYRDAKLVLFTDAVDSACGQAGSSTGPFYCPGDEKVYIDLGFFNDLHERFQAPGDFAQAYVIAHEIGHHMQKLLGVEEKVRRAQQSNPRSENELSVRMELQADCFAGVWGNSTAQRGILEAGDVEEGLNAASAIGDDRLQKMGRGRVSPESFTHGSSEQRVRWFRKGFESGSPNACDTFQVRDL